MRISDWSSDVCSSDLVTGRTRRIVVDGQGRQKVERRTSSSNIAETDNFMSGRKPILVFSEAGGTGRTYHADLGCPTAHKRRIHFLLEPGWRADIAIQEIGRATCRESLCKYV